MKVVQPFRNPGQYGCFLLGVQATAEVFGYKVDALAWGGGIPTDLTLYKPEDKPEPVVTTDVYAAGEETAELPTVEEVADANTEAKAE